MLARIVRLASISAIGLLALLGAAWIAKSQLAPALDLGKLHLTYTAASAPANLLVIEPFYPGNDSSLKEYGNARSDHEAIALAIAACDDNNADPARWSDATRARLLFELDQNSMHTLHMRMVADSGTRAPPLTLSPFQVAAISFSDKLSRDRLAYRRELEDNQDRARLYQIFILGLGALATMAIGVRSMLSGNNKALAIAIGVGAILFSAAGTAVSTMSNFDNSQGISLRDKRALAQLQQLHWRVASDVLGKRDLCNTSKVVSDAEQEQQKSWRERLEVILDNAVENVSRPGDLAPSPLLKDATPASPPAPAAKTTTQASAAP